MLIEGRCKVLTCNNNAKTRKLCTRHYQQILNHGKIINYDNIYMIDDSICLVALKTRGKINGSAIFDTKYLDSETILMEFAQEASDAYDTAAIKYKGEFALTNKMLSMEVASC
jgi:hypothetical protein